MSEACENRKSDFFSVETPEEGVTVVDFTKYNGPNIWTNERLQGFLDIVKGLEVAPNSDTVIFLMGNHFGADVKFFKDASCEDFHCFIDVINEAFNRVEALPCETVAVFGHCYGGGLELGLACKSRLGIRGHRHRVGLTETRFGLFPGAGGTQRLPKLVGNVALGMIARGDTLSIEEAKLSGLVDDFLREGESFYDGAKRLAFSRRRRVAHDYAYCDLVSDAILADLVGDECLHQRVAVEAVYKGLFSNLPDGLARERELFKANFPNDLMREKIQGFLERCGG